MNSQVAYPDIPPENSNHTQSRLLDVLGGMPEWAMCEFKGW